MIDPMIKKRRLTVALSDENYEYIGQLADTLTKTLGSRQSLPATLAYVIKAYKDIK